MKVKTRRSRERIERKALDMRKVVAVVSDVRDVKSEMVRKADVLIIDESLSKEYRISRN